MALRMRSYGSRNVNDRWRGTEEPRARDVQAARNSYLVDKAEGGGFCRWSGPECYGYADAAKRVIQAREPTWSFAHNRAVADTVSFVVVFTADECVADRYATTMEELKRLVRESRVG